MQFRGFLCQSFVRFHVESSHVQHNFRLCNSYSHSELQNLRKKPLSRWMCRSYIKFLIKISSKLYKVQYDTEMKAWNTLQNSLCYFVIINSRTRCGPVSKICCNQSRTSGESMSILSSSASAIQRRTDKATTTKMIRRRVDAVAGPATLSLLRHSFESKYQDYHFSFALKLFGSHLAISAVFVCAGQWTNGWTLLTIVSRQFQRGESSPPPLSPIH